MRTITTRLDDFDARLSAAEHAMTDNKLTVKGTLKQANDAMATAQMAKAELDNNSDRAADGKAKLADRKNQTERVDRLRERTNALVKKIEGESDEVTKLQGEYDQYEADLNGKNDRLTELIEKVKALYKDIKEAEKYHRICS